MARRVYLPRDIAVCLLILLVIAVAPSFGADDFPASRDACTWPFSRTSIWNMPIGGDAVYVDAQITPQTGRGTVLYHDIIIMTPDEPLMNVYQFPGGWSSDRCLKGDLLGRLPIPSDFYLPYTGKTVDHPAAILEVDKRTVNQSQPFHRCTGKSYASTKWWGYPDVDIHGPGIEGAHGGSGLSSLGGAIRIGEFRAGVIRHALKISMYAKMYYHYDKADRTPGYRWPAVKADGYAEGEYGGENPSFEMGALLALKPDFDVSRCKTAPGRIVAQAFQHYGGYVVDDSKWNVFKMPVEFGPAGDVGDEFRDLYGYDFAIADLDHPWPSDITTIFTNLHIVDNNGPESIGGGGTPCRPLAPPFDGEVNAGAADNVSRRQAMTGGHARYVNADLYDIAGRRFSATASRPQTAQGVYAVRATSVATGATLICAPLTRGDAAR